MKAERNIFPEATTRAVHAQAAVWRVFAACASAGILLVALLAYWRRQEVPEAAPKPLETVTARTADVSQTIDAPGKLTLFRYADIGTPLSGQVKEIHVSIGEFVKQGKLLVEIAPALETARTESNRAQLARLNADLADQKAQNDFAQLQFQRQTRLMADNATREETVEASRTTMLSSAAKMDATRAEIQQIEASMKEDDELRQQTKIVAPFSGTIVSLSVHQGQAVGAGQSALMRIADLSSVTVQARVTENDVTRLHKGMAAIFTTPGLPGRHWTGILNQIMPLPIDDSAQQGKPTSYMVLFDVANPDHSLMVGMSANVRFVVARAANAVTIPACLLHGKAEVQTLSVADADGKLSARDVRIGIGNAQLAQVLSGLRAGERVAVTHRPGSPTCLHPENAGDRA